MSAAILLEITLARTSLTIAFENRTGNGNAMVIRSLRTFAKSPLFLHGVAEPKHSLSCQIRALIGLVLIPIGGFIIRLHSAVD